MTLADAGRHLLTEDLETLVQMLLGWAKDDPRLAERLLLYAAHRAGPDTAAAMVSRAFENAVNVRGYINYREAPSWANGVCKATNAIEQLLKDGNAAAVIGLCESAVRSLADAIECVDDSAGHFSTLRDRLEEIHFAACKAALPDQADLAIRLFYLELNTNFDAFSGAAERYAKILGAEGLAAYGKLAAAEWAKVPVRTAGNERKHSSEHFRITHIMESLALASGDIEARVAVMSRDLSSAWDYVRIVEVYREARQFANALRWAERGLAAFPSDTNPRLREIAAEEYHRVRRHDEAMKLIWATFCGGPSRAHFQLLETHGKKAQAWPEWREKALENVRTCIARDKAKVRGTSSRWTGGYRDNSLLVEIFLHEGSPDEAWHEAGLGGCSDALWLKLANLREKEYPAAAVPIYLRIAEAAIARETSGDYEDPVALLLRAAPLMRRMNREPEFVQQLEALRAKYKIKRNFIKLTDKKRQALGLR